MLGVYNKRHDHERTMLSYSSKIYIYVCKHWLDILYKIVYHYVCH